MDDRIRKQFDDIRAQNRELQNDAFQALLALTNSPVDWAYEAWEDLLAMLRDPDNHQRAIGAQLLANLAKSDPNGRMLRDFDALLQVTKDERFVTARHCLQSLWKVGAAGKAQQQTYMNGLAQRFRDCAAEKNCTLIRFDIIQSMRSVYEAVGDASIREKAVALIETETDPKYRKKYAGVWRE